MTNELSQQISPLPKTPPQNSREESPEFLFTQALDKISEGFVGGHSITEVNSYAIASIAYSLLGITKQLDFIRMEMERMRQQYGG